ncbi:helix-turn-helix domain-containing protein [Nocardia sp. CA-120079]|uniref:helix-turn-helix domain-containing protein n=1 Tax=Nocardia sp. CA-120079 TaxID=3239974 RepID=UPI003D958BF5
MTHGSARNRGRKLNHKNILAVGDILHRLLSEPTVSVPDAARLLGVGKSTVYAAAKSGDVPAVRVGNRVRIPSRWVRQVLELQTNPADTDTL